MPPKKKKRTETVPSKAVWRYLDGDEWQPFAEADSDLIEAHHRKGVAAFLTSDLTFNKGFGTKYSFNFVDMQQTNMDSDKVRNLSRLPPPGEVQWSYEDDHGMSVPFYDEDVALIEGLWQAQGLNKPTTTTKLSFNRGYDTVYRFTFTSKAEDGQTVDGEQLNEDSKKVRKLRRTQKKGAWDVAAYGGAAAAVAPEGVLAKEASGGVAAATAAAAVVAEKDVAKAPVAKKAGGGHASATAPPSTWTGPTSLATAKPGEYTLVDVAAGSTEWDDVVKSATAGDFAAKVLRVQRVENPMLWGFYAMHRQHIVTRNKDDPSVVVERRCFYGERNRANMTTLLKLGFDSRVVGSIGKYGEGLYFGTTGAYTDSGRCLQNADKSKEVLLCRCATGLFAEGKSGLRRPPPKDPKKPSGDLYDACADSVKAPSVFVLFLNAQAYPEYVVTYRNT